MKFFSSYFLHKNIFFSFLKKIITYLYLKEKKKVKLFSVSRQNDYMLSSICIVCTITLYCPYHKLYDIFYFHHVFDDLVIMVIVELLMLEHCVINVVNYFEQHPNAMHYLYFVELQQLLKSMVAMDMVLTM